MLLSFLIKGVEMVSTLNKPKFKKLAYSSFGGTPLVKSLWDRFDLSLLMAQSGMHKKSGVPTWQLAFLLVIGLLAQCSSCSKNGRILFKRTSFTGNVLPKKSNSIGS